MGSCGEKGISAEVNLAQFSSTAVLKKEELYAATISLQSRKDFVMHVGVSVWALDWCSRVHERRDCHTK
ncbi:General transcription factor 3C polypeptide 2 [Melia azedarach]|uniref:General transcription factor 3C polypeptide 2 n=1 Tax=Melia azedarach TaxID=155640 RepID=A0ACC1X7C0_MELAZ|nr:General transcription factor 3C polypeptide 2 [Melia azedarach]